MSRFAVGILLGVIVSTGLSGLSFAAMPNHGVPWPVWYSVFRTISEALLAVAPGFAAGWFVGRSGLLIGAVVGVLASIASLVFVWSWWGALPLSTAAVTLIFGAAAAVITQSVAGAAGELIRSRKSAPPNNSFKPKPLRGSA
jgi:hypothetical protein